MPATGGAFVFDTPFFPSDKGGAIFPLAVRFVRVQTVAATALIQEISTFNGASVFPLGGGGDRVAFATQQFHAQAGLCHTSGAGTAFLGSADAIAFHVCQLPFTGDSPIVAAVPVGSAVAVGRRVVLDESCNVNQVAPFVVEMYAAP